MADKKRKKKPASLGCVFWIAFILLIIILFFFNKKNIGNILETTGASELFSGKKPAAEKTADGAKDPVPALTVDGATPAITPSTTPNGESAAVGDGSKEIEPPAKDATPEKPAQKTSGKKDAPKPDATASAQKTETQPKATEKTAVKPVTKQTQSPKGTTAKPAPQTRKSTLFFLSIDADGRVLRKEVSREIPASDSPLTDALKALLRGPTPAEESKGYRSLIPQGTKILSVIVKNRVATVNVSEEFQFNQYGIEGYLGQLAEIVFTATAFSTVDSVQFLIDGQRREYLGAEGVWIGSPLSRDKFQ